MNGWILGVGAYFGEASDRLVDRLLGEQLEDGGWNCDAPQSRRSSFHSTICVLEGLLEYEKAKGETAAVTEARVRAQEYLLERRTLRSLSSGEVIDPKWTRFSFPTTWHYDVLRGLDYLRSDGIEPDERVTEAIVLVAKKQDHNGKWPIEFTSTWKVWKANLAAGTLSAPYECWTGIQHDTNASDGRGPTTNRWRCR